MLSLSLCACSRNHVTRHTAPTPTVSARLHLDGMNKWCSYKKSDLLTDKMTAEKHWESWWWAAVNKWDSIYLRILAPGQGWSEHFGAQASYGPQVNETVQVGRAALGSGWGRVRRNSTEEEELPLVWESPPSFAYTFWTLSGGVYPVKWEVCRKRPMHWAVAAPGNHLRALCTHNRRWIWVGLPCPRGTSLAGLCPSWVGSYWKWGRAGRPEAEIEVRVHDGGELGLTKAFALWGACECLQHPGDRTVVSNDTLHALGAAERPNPSFENGM